LQMLALGTWSGQNVRLVEASTGRERLAMPAHIGCGGVGSNRFVMRSGICFCAVPFSISGFDSHVEISAFSRQGVRGGDFRRRGCSGYSGGRQVVEAVGAVDRVRHAQRGDAGVRAPVSVLQQRVVRERTPGLSCPQTPAGGLSTWSFWSCNQ